jgi:hypothetical protein
MFRIVVWRDGQYETTLNLIDGDSAIFEAPQGFTAIGKHAVLKWKLKKEREANKVLREKLDQVRTQLDELSLEI